MSRFTCTLAVATLAAATAHAQTMIEDTDGDGAYSMAEMQAAMPDLTEDQFTMFDTNADGVVDAEELAAAQEAGLLEG